MDRDTAENLVMGCVGTMLLFPAVEHSSLPDIVRAAQMIEASHPRPGNGRIEGTAVWLTALCIRFATRRCEAPTAIVVSDIRVASRRMPAARELLTGAAYAMLASTTYTRIIRLGAASLALAVEASRGQLIEFSEEDRRECAERHAEATDKS